MLEKDIEKYLREQVKKMGGIAYKFTSPATRGVPDRLVVFYKEVYFVEVKREGGVVRKLQEQKQEELRALGQKVYIVWSKTDVDAFLELVKEDLNDQHR